MCRGLPYYRSSDNCEIAPIDDRSALGVWGKHEIGFDKREEHMPKRDGQKRDADVLLRVVIALRRIKAERDLSDRAMAMQANVSYAFFKDIMDNGGNPSILVLDDMARRLGVALQDLLKDYTPTEKRALLRAWEAGELRREGLRTARAEAAARQEKDAKSAARHTARPKTTRVSARNESK